MAKIYPHLHDHDHDDDDDDRKEESLCGSGRMNMSSERSERYTVWMKSLVFHSNGCTVYDSNGDIVYRVDNYETKGTREVNLMDLRGRVLCTIHKRRGRLGFGGWDGFRYCSKREEMRWFEVKKCSKVACEMRVGNQKYCLVRMGGGKAAFWFKITNTEGRVVAEVKQKQSWSGVVLGDDVVTLDVEANMDHSLMVAFVMVYGLICGRM